MIPQVKTNFLFSKFTISQVYLPVIYGACFGMYYSFPISNFYIAFILNCVNFICVFDWADKKFQLSIETIIRIELHTHQTHITHTEVTYTYKINKLISQSITASVKTCCIKFLLLVLHISNWSA